MSNFALCTTRTYQYRAKGKKTVFSSHLCRKVYKHFFDYRSMTKEEQAKSNDSDAIMQSTSVEMDEAGVAPVDDRPNRKAFSERFAKRHSDIDFEDKEARYGAMNDDADMLSTYEKSGQALSKMLDNNKWLAAMVIDSTRKGMHPFEWMASQGIDIKAALEDEEMGKKVADQITKYQEKVAEQEKHGEQLMKNLQKSREALDKLGLSDEEADDLYGKVWAVIGDAEGGNISTDTWKLFQQAYNYDSDISSARDEAAMQARNEKIQNKVRSSASEGIPPSLASSGNGNKPAQPKQQKKKSSFFDGLID